MAYLMANPTSSWKIRFLDRLLQGREVWLNEGRLSLGEKGCDICIPLTINGKIVLREQEESLFVDAGKARVRVNGRRFNQNKPLPSSGVLQVAGIAMAFGKSDCDLASYQIPISTLRHWWLAGVFLIFIGGMGALSSIGGQPETVNDLPLRVKLLLDKSNIHYVRAQWKEDGSLQLSGYCSSNEQMQKVRATLESWGVMYRDSVICDDLLIREVQDILIKMDYPHAEVSSEGPGSVLIHDDIRMDQRWRKVQPLLADIPGLLHWKISYSHQSQGNDIIAAIIENGLVGLVNVTPIRCSFVISGVLDESHQRILQEMLAALKKKDPALSLIYQDIAPSHDGGKYLPAPVAGFVQSRHGDYLLLTNKERLRVGALLPDGGEIVHLSADVVTIKNDDTLINYPLDFK
ncbi:EscD/YscD/HrpQ family type III secretion system inner membrane ring protein [Salmonella enterica]|uniref:EscD/YscD/HrpQ family type III secretion system inner membrane ring protein n=1 Tax=Salmonella enterica subsp. diarizonae serovar 48:i:z TaxID=1192842 RepID=A0A735VWH5_SALDZ|nr:type III secretion system inner membrane ring subunit SctD [Salmonella enterica]EBP3538916.1 EscD/YscD/HrpQ family type III secretion system inner membrane ring protein [Salmonella enterica subsp. enterica]ECE5793509.1 EscD/YscD/HrpQ family type III secretion system inner membrane ring protein [Salmonella enterica subsp. diarizonae]EAR7913047.1 EscD/YscD/HrpQ family type III secretion system inner membrane ring protein [Salmonella enterica]EAT4550889.1 EscD/YscD/HrpQ family type III secretio